MAIEVTKDRIIQELRDRIRGLEHSLRMVLSDKFGVPINAPSEELLEYEKRLIKSGYVIMSRGGVCLTSKDSKQMGICEFCFRSCYTVDGHIPNDWDLVWKALVCPDCQVRIYIDGGYDRVAAGAYTTRKDPREKANAR